MSEECKKAKDGKHEPDWDSVSLDSDGGEVYVDVDSRRELVRGLCSQQCPGR